ITAWIMFRDICLVALQPCPLSPARNEYLAAIPCFRLPKRLCKLVGPAKAGSEPLSILSQDLIIPWSESPSAKGPEGEITIYAVNSLIETPNSRRDVAAYYGNWLSLEFSASPDGLIPSRSGIPP
ncbi:hypothetical protein C9939_05025, partial [Pseudidiomarina aestuarii]